ncbi:MAG TPA: CpaF family protein [Mycobacteriales bacterium]|nr:CpaF family protein [Mycobacteriales bacterium]
MSLSERVSAVPASNGRHRPLTDRSAGPRHGRAHDPFAAVKRSLHQALVERLGPRLYDPHMTQSELEERVRETLAEVLEREQTPLSTLDRTRIAAEVSDDILGYGPLEPLLRDPEVSEIMVNGADHIYVERSGRISPVAATFTDETHLRRIIDKIVAAVGRRVDETSPMADARLRDGSRVNVVIPPIALDGSQLTIRKFAADPFTDSDLVDFGTMTSAVRDFLDACVRGRLNVLISGGTGSGKTTTLNVLSGSIPAAERIITIEDAAELQLRQEHVLRLESRPSNIEGSGRVEVRDLVRNALRMRPDRIVVGEVRDGAALDMLQAMNTGHDGSLCTVHANSPRDALSRLETMVLMAGVDLPVRAIRGQVSSALDLVIHQTRFKDGTRKITHVTEVLGMESDIITLQDIFVTDFGMGYDDRGVFRGQLKSTGLVPHVLEKLSDHGVLVNPAAFGFERFVQ